MISKETFCRALELIGEQQETDRRFGEALNLVGNGHFAFGAENRYLEGLLLVLKEAVGDRYDYIGWWLYETTDYRVWSGDEKREWNLRDAGDLYDYIVDESTRTDQQTHQSNEEES